jgi:hypothetical protein
MFEKVGFFWLVLWIFCARAAREDERRRDAKQLVSAGGDQWGGKDAFRTLPSLI